MVAAGTVRHRMLTVCPTPIGNLGDVTQRVLDALRGADVIACEDTRRTRALLSALGIPAPRLVVVDDHSEERRAPALAADAADGRSVVLVSDAGMPGVADPGRELVRAVLALGAGLTVLPGPGAVETALVASGLAADRYAFAGWVPRAPAARRAFLSAAATAGYPVVVFESPRRAASALAALAAVAPDSRVALCRELTKLYEEVLRGSAAEVAASLGGRELRGEVAIVISGTEATDSPDDVADAFAAVAELVAAGVGARQASSLVARLTGQPRRALYDAAAAGKRLL
jgi:16S rRNA (cytidine1402-2'-O)-methyltransferase